MIPKGTIRKVGEYYFNNDKYKTEIIRGIEEFFDNNIPPNDQPLFNEWMMYNFIFSDGKICCRSFMMRIH